MTALKRAFQRPSKLPPSHCHSPTTNHRMRDRNVEIARKQRVAAHNRPGRELEREAQPSAGIAGAGFGGAFGLAGLGVFMAKSAENGRKMSEKWAKMSEK
jgi:hypothetical protein